ncbi:MAG: hypothetical protein WDM88_03060 [Galbitalea sp.]
MPKKPQKRDDDVKNPSRRRFITTAASRRPAGPRSGRPRLPWARRSPVPTAPDLGFEPLSPRSAARLRSRRVVMFENRSFDNVLGWLYERDAVRAARDSTGCTRAITRIRHPMEPSCPPTIYIGSTDHVMGQPNPDPGEFYPHVNTQLFDVIDPAEQRTALARTGHGAVQRARRRQPAAHVGLSARLHREFRG